ncbi:hypothetical protein GCM10022252_07900 [Streptosporangium oxazolinicum]|uniref:Uncharacterized protein n=1 Tax=Streptosporangium oxazolinicum TaxID=909287 RepID=A0ABP8ADM5_9ACTN
MGQRVVHAQVGASSALKVGAGKRDVPKKSPDRWTNADEKKRQQLINAARSAGVSERKIRQLIRRLGS